MLRYFHIQDISPSGWVTFDNYVKKIKLSEKKTNCNYEYETTWDNIIPNPEKESATPMKIMSWDIEASSSHGDFPVAKKSYRKMIGEVIQYWTKNKKMITKMNLEQKKKLLIDLIKAAYRYKKMDGISRVYLQNRNQKPSEREVVNMVSKIINYKLSKLLERRKLDEGTWFEKNKWENMDDEERKAYRDWDLYIPWEFKKNDILYCLSAKFDAGKKLDILDTALKHDETWIKGKNGQKGRMRSNKIIPGILPKLEGDNCTFIGSTFLKLGENETYYNNIIVLIKC